MYSVMETILWEPLDQ